MMDCKCERYKDYFGSTPKYLFELTVDDLSMADFDFQVRLQRGPNAVVIEKDEMIVDGEGNYFITFDTKALGIGPVRAIIIASIPDTDYPDGVRTEVDVIENFTEILELPQ